MTPEIGLRADHRAIVKICGIRRVTDVDAAVEAGADYIGLVFASSRRQVTVDEARGLVVAVGGRVPTVGVFVDATTADMRRIAGETGIDVVQLSGSEGPEGLEALEVPYIKTIHTRAGTTSADMLHITTTHRGAAAFLVDAWSPLGGGSGTVADWSLARKLVKSTRVPVFVAGGLKVENVAQALHDSGAVGVDVSSGVERDGWKDESLMREFVKHARQCTAPGVRDF